MKVLAVLFVLALPALSHAETFNCTFTEPFLSVTYSTSTGVLSMKSDLDGQLRETANIDFTITANGEYSLTDSAGTEVAHLKLTSQGSDGMSNTVYPFEISVKSLAPYANSGVGGCSSSKLPVIDPGE